MRIHKNNSSAGSGLALTIMKEMGYGSDQCMVLSNGILLDMLEVERYRKRRKSLESSPGLCSPSQDLIFVPLSFKFSQISDLGYFKSFRRLLWFTSVHFDTCFDRGIWTTDERGVYCRSDVLKSGLSNLSRLHNMICAALEYMRRGHSSAGWIKIRAAFELLKAVVQTYHHRQLPDLLAIVLILHRADRSDLVRVLMEQLHGLAEIILQRNDPRKKVFQEISQLSMDAAGDLYVAFDACCRQLWMKKAAGDDKIKAYYGYNQASLPRTTSGGFYSLYDRKSGREIRDILQQVDQKFEPFEHPRICLWHTAIRYLIQEKELDEAKAVCNHLMASMLHCQEPSAQSQQRQWNVDISLTYYLLGSINEYHNLPSEAVRCFRFCVIERSKVIAEESWDPTLCAALNKIQDLAPRTSDFDLLDYSTRLLGAIESALAKEDMMRSELWHLQNVANNS